MTTPNDGHANTPSPRLPCTVSPVSTDELTAACRVLFAHQSGPDRDRHALRCRDLLTAGEMDPAGLFVARDERGAIRGAILVQPLLGALGLAWPPRAEPGRDQAAIEDALIPVACAWLRSRGVKVCQAFVAEDERPAMAPLERHGFRRVTQVSHMRREIDPLRDRAPEGIPATLAFAVEGSDADFEVILNGTYEGSLDCPEVTGTRTPGELVEGFHGSSQEGPDRRPIECWYFIKNGEARAGVILLERSAEPGVWELAYLGLLPEFRGQGLGRAALRLATRLAVRRGFHALNVSVDVRNEPALRLYQRHGFAEYDRQDVYLALWPPPG